MWWSCALRRCYNHATFQYVGIRFFTVGGAFIMCLPVPYIPHT